MKSTPILALWLTAIFGIFLINWIAGLIAFSTFTLLFLIALTDEVKRLRRQVDYWDYIESKRDKES